MRLSAHPLRARVTKLDLEARQPLSCDVVVIGGGPAGAACAISLARAGRSTVLVDKARFPRDKFCGDGLTAWALRLLDDLGLDPSSIPSWNPVDEVILRTPAGREVTFSLPKGPGIYAAVARRYELDDAVLALARRSGVKVLDSHACVGAKQFDDRVVVDIEGVGLVHARYAIGADGMWSPLRKMIGLQVPGYLGEWHAFRQYFRNVSEAASRELYVSFDSDLLPGYFWSFPVGVGAANVGFGIRRDGNVRVSSMKTLWPDILERPHVRAFLGADAEPESPHRAWPIPARVDRIMHSAGRVLFVGDAAAATDALTGEGIGQALATGIWAADAVIAAGAFAPDNARRHYEATLRNELIADHRMSALLSRALGHRNGVRIAVGLSGLSSWSRQNFARWLFEDYPRSIITTPRRWQPGMFNHPGAFRR